MVRLTYEEHEALSGEEKMELVRRKHPTLSAHVVWIMDPELVELTGKVDSGGWDILDLRQDIKDWCSEHLAKGYQFQSILYAQGARIGEDYFADVVEFGDEKDALHFRLRWT